MTALVYAEIIEDDYSYFDNFKYLSNWGTHLGFLYFWSKVFRAPESFSLSVFEVNFSI